MTLTSGQAKRVIALVLIALIASIGLLASFQLHGAPQQPLRPGNSLHLGDRSIAGDSIAGD